jgi:hypothetical protein
MEAARGLHDFVFGLAAVQIFQIYRYSEEV